MSEVDFVRPAAPARLAAMMPDRASMLVLTDTVPPLPSSVPLSNCSVGTVWLLAWVSKTPPLIVTLEPVGMALIAPSCSVPALTFVAP